MRIYSRILPFAEWGRLAGTELAHLAGLSNLGTGEPPNVTVIVVEEDDGLSEPAIVGCWAIIQAVHVEGFWFREDKRAHAGIGRVLLTRMIGELQRAGVAEVMTQSLDSHVSGMLEKIGGRRVPGETWTFPVPAGPPVADPVEIEKEG